MFFTLINVKLSLTSLSADTILHLLFLLSHVYILAMVKDAGMKARDNKNTHLPKRAKNSSAHPPPKARISWAQQA